MRGLVPGLSLAIVSRSEILYEQGYGYADLERERPVTPETVFYTASLAKAFTGMTAAVLAARGEFDLDAPLIDFFPGLSSEPPVRANAVTVRDLLAHHKGFTNGAVNFVTTWVGPFESDELVRVLNEHSSPAPGFAYANTNYALAGDVISRAAGASWKNVMDRAIFTPLGTLRIEPDGDRLSVEWGDLRGPVLPAGGDTFLVDWIDGQRPDTFEFRRSAGRVTGFDWGGRPFERG